MSVQYLIAYISFNTTAKELKQLPITKLQHALKMSKMLCLNLFSREA